MNSAQISLESNRPPSTANADSGASGNYIAVKDTSCLRNLTACTSTTQISVQVANNQVIQSSHIGELHVPGDVIMKAYIFPHINGSLLSISQFVDVGFIVTYTSNKVEFIKNNQLVFVGDRDPISRLWMVNLSLFSVNTAVPAIRLSNKEELVRYWHACLGFPTKSTMLRALKIWLTIPDLTFESVKKYLPNVINTALGHLDATRKNIASTRVKTATSIDSSPPAIWIGEHQITGRVHLDAAGALPFKGRDGSNYLLIFYSEDKNYVHVVHMKSRSAAEYQRAINSALQFFRAHRISTAILRMDNECSELVKKYVRDNDLVLELTPASQHRTNKAERSIRSFKNHFISSMAGVDEDSPVDLWSDYTNQIEETLNLLRLGRSGKSAWEDLFGPRDFNKVPIAPIGIKVVAHVPPEERSSWAQHGLVGYYIGPAHEHYRCYRIWIPSTKAIRTSNCCEWFPASILSTNIDEKLAALPLLPPPDTPNFQSVEEVSRKQRVATEPAAPISPVLSVPADITVTNPKQLHHEKRRRSPGYYRELSKAELNKLPKAIFAKVGQQYVDNEDPADSTSGIIINIVMHCKSRKLQFKCYNSELFPNGPPVDKMDFDYISVAWAMKSCTFRKIKAVKSLFAQLAAQINTEEKIVNMGPTASNRRKQRKQRQRPRLEWYQLKALAAREATKQHGELFYALSSLELNADGTRLTCTSALKGPDREEWLVKFGEEIERLLSSGTGTFIDRAQVPFGKKIAYYNPQLKSKMKNGVLVKRVRGVIGGDQLPFDGFTAAQTAALEVIRLLCNCTVSEAAMLMTLDIKDFYLGTPLEESEYMRVPLKYIPLALQEQHNLKILAHNDAVIMRIDKSIYGLKQAGILSQQRLIAHLAEHGYLQCKFTPCLFMNATNGTAFTLVVDDFLVKYKNESAKLHLINCLQELYQITVDTAQVQKYVGITIDYNRAKRYMDLSMPGYVDKALIRFNKTNVRPVNSPMTYVPPNYGAKSQTLKPDNPAPKFLNAAQILFVQEVVGVFLYYSRAVDPLMITAINKIGSSQAGADISILDAIERFFQYASRWKNNVMRIHASDMKLNVHSDASYLSETKSRSRAGAFMYMGDKFIDGRPNAPVSYLSVIISTVVDSATAAEYAAAFIAAQAATSIRITLGELGYPQAATPITSDNACAVGIANQAFTQKRSKTIDMRYHWIQDQIKLGNFTITWKPGVQNLADLFTKAHPVEHHLKMISLYSVIEEGVLNNMPIITD